MNIETFLQHYGLLENPFEAEEAAHDPVFERLLAESCNHPDFGKILGRIDRPSTSIVFGEKGSGKTAIRLLIGRKVGEHNRENSEQRTLLVPYDDLNPLFDRFMRRQRRGPPMTDDAKIEQLLNSFRLEDHQDAILSLAVTRLIDAMVGKPAEYGDDGRPLMPNNWVRRLRKKPRQRRVDLAVLAAMYDQPRSGPTSQRFNRLLGKLRLRKWPLQGLATLLSAVGAIVGAALTVGRYMLSEPQTWMMPAGVVLVVASVLLIFFCVVRKAQLSGLVKRVRKDMPAVERPPSELLAMLGKLRAADLLGIPWPLPGLPAGATRDSRYQLTARLLDAIEPLGYTGMMVLVDRVDEPTFISGKPKRMQPLIWVMFDNKFLQQERVGFKLLLPVELRHMLHHESADFFQEARMDKQNLIDRLTWSGVTLYDLCSARLRACREGNGDSNDQQSEPAAENLTLMDLFQEDVTRETLVDALDKMHQPRDAFKFMYSVIQEHCRMVPEDSLDFRVPRLVLETVRRSQSQRVQDLYRGLAPA